MKNAGLATKNLLHANASLLKNCFFVMLIFFKVNGFAQDKKVTIRLAQQPLTALLRQIEQQTGYNMVYSDEVVTDSLKISVNVHRMPVSKLLDSVLKEKKLFYQLISSNMIAIGSRIEPGYSKLAAIPLSGAVLNSEGKGIPFASITLYENGRQVNGAIANGEGVFLFMYALTPDKSYQLRITCLGYETYTLNFISEKGSTTRDFGRVTLSDAAKNLKGVTITGNQPLIEMEGGNIVFNVAKSVNAHGLNALELLGRAPGVTVGSDNSIALNGKGGASVLMDGRQTYLSDKEIAELLKSMSSGQIKSIEIIHSPGAKYDASGTAGIINIRTLQSVVQGFNAGFTTGLSYGVYLRNNQDLSFSYRKNKVNVFGNYNHFIGHYSYLYGADRIQEGLFYNSFTDDVDKRNKLGSRLGADFAINKKQTLGILLNGNFIFGGGITDTRTDIGIAGSPNIEEVLTAVNDYYQQKTQRYNVNLNYKYEDSLGNVLNFDADYGDFTKRAGNLQTNKYTDATNTVLSDNLYRSLNGIDIGLRAVKLDYVTRLGKGKLEAGGKYSSVTSANDSRFLAILPGAEVLDPTRSNGFIYREEITSAYLNFKRDIDKWQFQAGLRMENAGSTGRLDQISVIAGNSRSNSRNYTNFFPFFSAAVKPSASHSFSFSYSRRIDRPAYQNLNPFIYLLDELSYWQGNPFLKPQLSHRGLLQYVYKSAPIVGLSYTYTDDFSVEVTDTVDQNKIVMVPRNLGTQQHLAFTLTHTLTPRPWWNISFNGTFYGLMNKIHFGARRNLTLKQAAGRFSLQQTFKLPYQVSAEVIAQYNSRRLTGANQFPKATSQVDLGMQRNFLDNKATLRLAFSDVYKGNQANSVQTVGGLYMHNYSYFESRQVKVNFSYRIASGNSKGPRNRNSALENENGRIKQ